MYPHGIKFYMMQVEAYDFHFQPDQPSLAGCPLCLEIKSSTLIVPRPIVMIPGLLEHFRPRGYAQTRQREEAARLVISKILIFPFLLARSSKLCGKLKAPG